MAGRKINIAVVGCGFVSPFYMDTINNFSSFRLCGIFDLDPERAQKQGSYYKVPVYNSYEEILNNSDIEIIVNLTDPSSHFGVSLMALHAGKHVYTEKPFCTSLHECEELVKLAKKKGLMISSAPCSLLGPTAQAIWKSIKRKDVGEIRLVYAEMDDGPVFLMNPEKWKSVVGTPWPYKNEFRTGSTLEHLGYTISWLVAFFGPAVHVTSFSECLVKNKMPDMETLDTPDFSVAVVKHTSGVVSRITCGIVAPVDRGMKIVGEKGLITINNFWNIYEKPKKLMYSSLKLKAERKPLINNSWILKRLFGLIPVSIPIEKKLYNNKLPHNTLDYCLGIDDMARSIIENKDIILNADFSLHVAELTLKIHNSLNSGTIKINNTFDSDTFEKTNFAKFQIV
jgi:predicted dehydrogenase